MNDLYKPVDVKRLMELAGLKEAPDMSDPIIAAGQGANVSTADIAKASSEKLSPSNLTTSDGKPIASGTPGVNWNAAAPTPTPATPAAPAAPTTSAPTATTTPAAPTAPTATTTPVPTATSVPSTPVAPESPARPAYAGSAGSQAIQKLNPAIKDVNKIQA